MNTLAERLKIVRESIEKGQKEMAIACGASYRMWQAYETGDNQPSVRVIESLVRLGFDSNWLLTGEGEMKRVESCQQAAAVGETDQGYGLPPDMVELVRLLDRYGNKALVENVRTRLMKIKQDTEG